jgi:hypothetical protein
VRPEENKAFIGLVGLLLGVVVGVLFRVPLFPYVLPDSIVNAISAGVGAAFAVLGAAWLAHSKERKQSRELRLVLNSVGRPLNNALLEVIKMCGSKEGPGHKADLLRRKLRKLKTEYEAHGPRLEELKPIFQVLGPVAMFSFLRLSQVRHRVSRLIEEMESADRTANGIDASFKRIETMASRAQKRLVAIKNGIDLPLSDEIVD